MELKYDWMIVLALLIFGVFTIALATQAGKPEYLPPPAPKVSIPVGSPMPTPRTTEDKAPISIPSTPPAAAKPEAGSSDKEAGRGVNDGM